MSGDDVQIALEPDLGWVEVPDDPELDTQAWALEVLQEAAGPGLSPDDDDRLRAAARALALYADAARDPAAPVDVAWVYVPDPLAPPYAVCHLDLLVVAPPERPDLDALEAVLAAPAAEHLDTPTVERRLLPAGWAVRQRVLRTDEPDGGDVQEAVVWALLPTGTDDVVLQLTTTWRSVVHGDLLAEQADRLAAALGVELLPSSPL